MHKVGNEELENWLLQKLSPRINFRFDPTEVDARRVVVLEIESANGSPVQFHGQPFVRVGSYKKRLKDHPEKERDLWRLFDRVPAESRIGLADIASADVLSLLDHGHALKALGLPALTSPEPVLARLEQERLIERSPAGRWNILTVGAISLAARLRDFPFLERKALRIIQYQGRSRVDPALPETLLAKGYAVGFDEALAVLERATAQPEEIANGRRQYLAAYPALALRELLVNALIHQDLTVTGPMVEVFLDRVEFSNPGQSLVLPARMVDNPPRSRNERLASLMRRIGLCEERGSGLDKVVSETERAQLPDPLFEVGEQFTRTTVFQHRPLAELTKEERVRACYLHTCLRYVSRQAVTNSSVRERFGLGPAESTVASRILKEALDEKLIVIQDPTAGKKMTRYVPFWVK